MLRSAVRWLLLPLCAAVLPPLAAAEPGPTLCSSEEAIATAHDLALDVLRGNIRPWKRGLLETARPAIMAGAGYASPWTRDASYNTFFAAGLLHPEVARSTLLSVLVRDEATGRVRIGGQYWDSMSWTTGAWSLYAITGDEGFLRLAFDATRNSLAFFRESELDEATGLFCGPGWSDGVAGYPAPYDQAGGSSFILDHARHHEAIDKIRMRALSTNCLYYHAHRLAARMGRILGRPEPEVARFEEQAEALREAIDRHLWLPERGHYAYFLDRDGRADPSMEGLGHAHAILFGVASPERARSIFERQFVSPHGIPCVWPLFPRFSREAPGRHCGTVWPQIQGFWALAAAERGRVDVFGRELRALTRCALRSRDFREIYHPFTGEPYGGIQVGRLWRSEPRQTWAATAYLAMVYRGLLGLRFEPDGIEVRPTLPPSVGPLEVEGIRYRDMTLRIVVTGSGTLVQRLSLDGEVVPRPWIPADLQGEHEVRVHVGPDESAWIRPAPGESPLVWGRRDGIVFGLPSPGGMPGPRGLVRVGIPRPDRPAPDLINFIAFEPVVGGRKGLSELESSGLDGVQGKRLTVLGARQGRLRRRSDGGEELVVDVECERFRSGAHLRAELRVGSDRPEELRIALFAAEGSAPMEECTVTATMGNYGRLRLVTLGDRWLDSRRLYPDYTGDGFVEGKPFPLARLPRLPGGDVLVASVSDEEDPARVPIPRPRWWQYRSVPLTHYWRVPAEDVRPDLRLRLNGRRVYWQSRREIPGGIAFENFELRQGFESGQTFIFGLTRRSPRELGVDPEAPETPEAPVGTGSRAPWHHPLYLDGGGVWRRRIPIDTTNASDRAVEGFPVDLAVGSGEGQLDIAGAAARSLRLCDASGTELLFEVRDRSGKPVRSGEVPAGSVVTLPTTCAPAAGERLYLYFDNPSAWQVPDFLDGRPGIRNGSLEEGEGDAPSGWRHDASDATHRAEWVTEDPRSGERCLKTVVRKGAEPTWIATRQRGIRVLGGARYVLRGWVRARDVEGFAGWYAHVGDPARPMRIAPMLSGGGGTYDWKEVEASFEAPPEATTLSVGTVLRGTGAAWFDDLRLEPIHAPVLRARARSAETLDVREVSHEPTGAGADALREADVVARVSAVHLGDRPLHRALIAADIAPVLVRARRYGRSLAPRPLPGGGPLWRLADRVLLEADLPARSILSVPIGLYAAADDAAMLERPAAYASILESERNLLGDPSFEAEGETSPWTHRGTPDGIRVDRAGDGLFGRRAARVRVEDSAAPAWSGWRQDAPVDPGATYLYAAWVRCEDVRDGGVLLHAHFLDSDGKLSRVQGFASVGPTLTGTRPWTLLSGVLTPPEDAAKLDVHLTMNARGTVWHDGALLLRLVPGTLAPPEPSADADSGGAIAAWPVPAVIKVFEEDGPPARDPRSRGYAGLGSDPPEISLARRESEAMQIAIRSRSDLGGVRVEVDPPRDDGGRRLDDVAVHVVGYVPIDRSTNYYRSDRPARERRIPRGSGGSDGWPGRWPDPLLPRSTVDLRRGVTQPVWITVRAGAEAVAGVHEGAVRLVRDGTELTRVPFRVLIRDFTLPQERHVGAIYDVRLGPEWRLPGRSEEETRFGLWRFLAERRLSADRIQPDPVIRYESGRVVTDFTGYDRAAEVYFDECRFPFTYTPRMFYLFGWGHPPSPRFAEAPYEGEHPYEGADRAEVRPAFRRAYQACLRAYWEHMKDRGWSDRCVLYISDEPHDSHPEILRQMEALCEMIHEVDPEIPIYSSTWHHQAAWDGHLDVWGLGHYGVAPPQLLRSLRERGDRVWFTTDGQMCTDTPLCAVERLLPHYCFHYGVEAYEFWGCTWLTYDPYEFGWHAFIHQSSAPGTSTWVRYPNGDGYLIYPGATIGHDGPVSSIRLEQAREGVEDYEYLWLLRDRIAQATERGIDVEAARETLRAAATLVEIPNAGGRFSTRILPDPEEIYRRRDRVARTIERLGKAIGPEESGHRR